MTLATALALLVATASPDLLAEARGAFAAADYPAAERLALQAAAPDRPATERAAATYLVGLARFRSGRFAEALQALDAAEGGADSAAAWSFNRAACLSELGRHAEAEAADLLAARDPAFAPLALVEAGWAALEAGAVARARDHAARARAVATPEVEPLVAALERELAGGGAPPAPAATQAAQATRGELGARLDVGWDGDALHSGTTWLERPGATTVTAPSAFTAASAWASGRVNAGGGALEASYAFGQLAYLARAARDQSLQAHDAALAYRRSPRPGLTLEAGLSGQLALAGLEDLRAMQLAGGARVAARLETGAHAATQAEVAWTAKRGQGSEFDYLGGDRLDAALAEEGRWEGLTLRAGYRFQLERIGEISEALPAVEVLRICPPGPGGMMATCTSGADVQPLSYAGQGGFASAEAKLWGWLELSLDGSLQWRDYLHDTYALLVRSDGSTAATRLRRRHDWRWATGASATASLGRHVSVSLRHAWLGSAYGATVHPAGLGMMAGAPLPGGGSWQKQVVQLGLIIVW